MQKTAIDFKNFIIILIILGVMMFLNGQGYLDGIKNAALNVISPVESRFQSSSNIFSDFIYTVRKIGEFKSENERLEQENRSLIYEASKTKELQKENEELRKQLKFKENMCGGSDCIEFVAGKIIGRSPDSYGKSIQIDLGIEDGARSGMAVTIAGGIMIGKITETFDHYSKVMLLVSPDSSVNCITQTTRANGLLRGKYGTGAMLEMIDQSEDLTQGDLVITSGLESGIPKGILLGKIANVEQSPNMVFKSADMELFADMGHIEEVFLVKTK